MALIGDETMAATLRILINRAKSRGQHPAPNGLEIILDQIQYNALVVDPNGQNVFVIDVLGQPTFMDFPVLIAPGTPARMEVRARHSPIAL
jgi:hypothetical protein